MAKTAVRRRKYVYDFEEGSASMGWLLGNKGAHLAEMTKLGLPVPPGFIITTEASKYYFKTGQFPPGLEREILQHLKKLEKKMGRKFGDKDNPLLVSVRSGAPVSMPGMMDTVLNLGLNDETVKGLMKQSGDERFALDAYRRFIQMFGSIVMGVPRDKFEEILSDVKRKYGVEQDHEIPPEGLREVIRRYKQLVKEHTKREFPSDPYEQLMMAVRAVFDSWNNERAIAYRRIHGIRHDLGTGVNIQAMVFGNMGYDSGTGVGFTRDPATGEKRLYAEYLPNAQGEDVVAGIRTPMDVSQLKNTLPEVYAQLEKIAQLLERHYGDIQDFEFTVEKGKLYMLQTRSGKRTGMAAIRIAVDMVKEGLIDEKRAIMLVDPNLLEQLLHEQFERKALSQAEKIAEGIAASPGAASGRVVFTADDAIEWAKRGEPVILVRRMTSPDDVAGMHASKGVLTSEGGRTSHAAVVARGMGKPCVVGCRAIYIDYDKKQMSVNGKIIKEGEFISIDGTYGNVYLGNIPTVESEIIAVERGKMKPSESQLYQYYSTFMKWVDKYRKLGVRANADTPTDAEIARRLGAEGIGLARTEHMFFAEDRLPHFQRMILADTPQERIEAANKILPMQRKDFYELLKVMDGLPVIIRLLDPPLHEFLPHTDEDIRELAERFGMDPEDVKAKVERLRENNPMLGHRGCRLGITFPEIYRMQVRAIFEAACDLKKAGYNPKPEVMIPLVSHVNELIITRNDVVEVAEEVMKRKGVRVDYLVGTMIEVPRAAITADKIATVADFFSFGTNDLTQTVYGFSRDDVEAKFMAHYLEQIPGKEGTPIFLANPFEVLDREGVGELIKVAVERGRAVNPKLEIGICGEHGGEPSSVMFCHEAGLDYVSCSPFRIPVAKLAAAQAAIMEKQKEGGEQKAEAVKATKATRKAKKTSSSKRSRRTSR
jgi:pyruvate,orthophosphate dikinase